MFTLAPKVIELTVKCYESFLFAFQVHFVLKNYLKDSKCKSEGGHSTMPGHFDKCPISLTALDIFTKV